MPPPRRAAGIIRIIQSDTEDDDTTDDDGFIFDGEESEGHTEQGLIEGTHYVLSLDNSEHSNGSRSISPSSLYSASSSLFAPGDSRDSDSQAGPPSVSDASNSENSQPTAGTSSAESRENVQIAPLQATSSFDSTENVPIATLPITPTSKKRKLSDHDRTPVVGQNLNDSQDYEEGLCCPICLEYWETHGPHRLVSLKCGHLFGESCIRRWISESVANRCCPQCKAKCLARDFRYLYAKRVRAIDRSEEHHLKMQLDKQKVENEKLRTRNSSILLRETLLVKKLEAAQQQIFQLQSCTNTSLSSTPSANVLLKNYRLSLEKNLDMTKDSQCRVMLSNKSFDQLLISQKQSTNMFGGFGIRFVDIVQGTFKMSHFIHTSSKSIRDIALSSDGEYMACASQESKIKLFDLNSKGTIKTFSTPQGIPSWACAISASKNDFYMGVQNGKTFIYDVRGGDSPASEHATTGDLSPVINLAIIPKIPTDFPFGGFIVCKLTSVYIFEFTSTAGETKETKLVLDGPFVFMTYNQTSNRLLISSRNNATNKTAKYYFGKIMKVDGVPIFDYDVSFNGSSVTPVMTRCALIPTADNTLIAGYQHDAKVLNIYDTERKAKLQCLPVTEVILDTCAISYKDAIFMGALSEQKCRIYRINSSQYKF